MGNWFFEIKEFGQTPEREEKKMKRKLMTMLLALCLVVTMMPAMTSTASAVSTIEKVTAEITAVIFLLTWPITFMQCYVVRIFRYFLFVTGSERQNKLNCVRIGQGLQ